MVITKIYSAPPICKKEILRYAGYKSIEAASDIESLLDECLEEILPKLSYKVCYMELPIHIEETLCDFGCMRVESQDLVKNLQGCEKVLLFAATIGVEIDRLIMKYGKISPTKAVIFQAIGAERIESLCDAFCEDMTAGCFRPRFSPGYGDLPLETQKEIFQVLGCSKCIGLTLNESLLMSPSKSVTAFAGIGNSKTNRKGHNCASCEKTDCAYRI